MLTRHYPSPLWAYARHSLSYLLAVFFRHNGEAARSPVRVRRILIVNIGHIGDALMSFGVARNLRATFPDAHITAVIGAWSESIMRADDGIDGCILYNGGHFAKRHPGTTPAQNIRSLFRTLRRPKFDLVVSMNTDVFTLLYGVLCGARYRVDFGAYRVARRLSPAARVTRPAGNPIYGGRISERHIYADFMCLLEVLGIPAPEALPAITPRAGPGALPVMRALDRGISGAPLILVHPFGAYPEKEWAAERYAGLIERLVETHSARVLVTGAPGDETKAAALAELCAVPFENLVGRTSVPSLGAVMRKTDLVITGDGGPMHLAAAVGARVIALFGPTDPERWGPLSPQAVVFYRATDCGPCDRAANCIRHPRCVDRTGVEDVAAKVAEILADR